MGKIKKFSALNIRKISGGKDPIKIVQNFIMRRGFDPTDCLKEKTPNHVRWMLSISEEEDLEILIEGLKIPSETTVYMGVNIATVPIRNAQDVLITALEVADGLVGIKVSLVGHFLILSASMGLSGLTVEDLDYHYRLIIAQQSWFRESLVEELGWENLPDE